MTPPLNQFLLTVTLYSPALPLSQNIVPGKSSPFGPWSRLATFPAFAANIFGEVIRVLQRLQRFFEEKGVF